MLIGAKYKIESDDMNVILFKKKQITGTGKGRPSKREVGSEYWATEAYFSSPKQALKYIISKEIMVTGLEDFKTVVEKIDELHKLIEGMKI